MGLPQVSQLRSFASETSRCQHWKKRESYRATQRMGKVATGRPPILLTSGEGSLELYRSANPRVHGSEAYMFESPRQWVSPSVTQRAGQLAPVGKQAQH